MEGCVQLLCHISDISSLDSSFVVQAMNALKMMNEVEERHQEDHKMQVVLMMLVLLVLLLLMLMLMMMRIDYDDEVH